MNCTSLEWAVEVLAAGAFVIFALAVLILYIIFVLKVLGSVTGNRREIYYMIYVKRNKFAFSLLEQYLYILIFSSDDKSCQDAEDIHKRDDVDVLIEKQLFHARVGSQCRVVLECYASSPQVLHNKFSVNNSNERIFQTLSNRFSKRYGHAQDNVLHFKSTIQLEDSEESTSFPFSWEKEFSRQTQNSIPETSCSVQASGNGAIGMQCNITVNNPPQC